MYVPSGDQLFFQVFLDDWVAIGVDGSAAVTHRRDESPQSEHVHQRPNPVADRRRGGLQRREHPGITGERSEVCSKQENSAGHTTGTRSGLDCVAVFQFLRIYASFYNRFALWNSYIRWGFLYIRGS